MRIPDGADFDAPAEGNHFSSVFVLHTPTKTVHDDDTIMFVECPGLLLWAGGFRRNSMVGGGGRQAGRQRGPIPAVQRRGGGLDLTTILTVVAAVCVCVCLCVCSTGTRRC
jgi:hypothetical protein